MIFKRLKLNFILCFTNSLLLLAIFLILNDYSKHESKLNQNQTSSLTNVDDDDFKIFISYVHKLDTNDEISHENFKFFMNFGLLPCDDRVHFRIILNTLYVYFDLFEELGKILKNDDLIAKLKICSNIEFIKRLNVLGTDLCGHIQIFKNQTWKQFNQYKFYFFINSSVRGPFLPNYWTEPW
jgi:hypothetical protein